MRKQRISYVPWENITDPDMVAEFERAAREGTPRPETHAVRAHVPAVFWSLANTWKTVFKEGVCDHAIKELCRVYVSHSVICEYCGNQRSVKAANAGKVEDDYLDLLNFENSERYNEKEKTALAFAEAITWDIDMDDDLWDRLHKHFTEPEIVELGYFVGLTMGQQRFIRHMGIEHHEYLAGTDASMAPGMETKDALEKTKSSPDYWAKRGRFDAKERKQKAS